MDQLFTAYGPSTGSDVDFSARMITNKFGDGYRQTLPDGLNAVTRTWQLTWNQLPIADCTGICNFLESHIGKPFLYTLPRETTPRKWDCNQWKRGYPSQGWDSLSATFMERFDNT